MIFLADILTSSQCKYNTIYRGLSRLKSDSKAIFNYKYPTPWSDGGWIEQLFFWRKWSSLSPFGFTSVWAGGKAVRKQQIPAGNYLPPHDAFLRNLVSVLPLVGALHIPTSSPSSPTLSSASPPSPSSDYGRLQWPPLQVPCENSFECQSCQMINFPHLPLALWYMSLFFL